MRYFLVSAAVLAAALSAGQVSAADSAPLRHLVYSFTYTVATTDTYHTSGLGQEPSSGLADYNAGALDQGTITADVLQASTDGGLVVRISEQARENRSAAPATCVVYGNPASAMCDTNAKVNDEEMALLLVLGRNFIDPTEFDANRHWQRSQTAPNVTQKTDYTAGAVKDGVLDITLLRQTDVAGAQGYKETTNGALTYNIPLSLPVKLSQDEVLRQEQGVGQSRRSETKIVLQLVSDSMQTAKK